MSSIQSRLLRGKIEQIPRSIRFSQAFIRKVNNCVVNIACKSIILEWIFYTFSTMFKRPVKKKRMTHTRSSFSFRSPKKASFPHFRFTWYTVDLSSPFFAFVNLCVYELYTCLWYYVYILLHIVAGVGKNIYDIRARRGGKAAVACEKKKRKKITLLAVRNADCGKRKHKKRKRRKKKILTRNSAKIFSKVTRIVSRLRGKAKNVRSIFEFFPFGTLQNTRALP